MHRGSSKGAQDPLRSPESLPLSASAARLIPVDLEVTRAGRSIDHHLELPGGTRVRDALRRIDLPPEGCLVLDDGRSLPLDAPLDRPRRLQIVPTHSGG